jgi:hypothetical protein
VVAAQIQLHCGAPFTAVTHPLSVLNAPLVYIGHHTHEVAVREQVKRCIGFGGLKKFQTSRKGAYRQDREVKGVPKPLHFLRRPLDGSAR